MYEILCILVLYTLVILYIL